MDERTVTAVREALEAARGGDAAAGERLFVLLEDDLRALAGHVFRSQRRDHTLQPTALVNECYVRFSRALEAGRGWEDRGHFLAVAARAMRQVVLNHARERSAAKRGGPDRGLRITLAGVGRDQGDRQIDALAVHEALEALSSLKPRQARIAELKFFAGLSHEEIAGTLGVSVRTVEVDWRLAKTWLAGRLD